MIGGVNIINKNNEESLDLRQRLLKYELSKIDTADVPTISEAERINMQVREKVNEIMAAWENSCAAPFEEVAKYRILAEFNNTVLAARDNTMNGYGFEFVTWRYDRDHSGFDLGYYFEDYEQAKESFAIRSGLVEKERFYLPECKTEIGETGKFLNEEPHIPQEKTTNHGKSSLLGQLHENLKEVKPPSQSTKKKNVEIGGDE